MGQDFALSLQRCESIELIFGDTFVTAGGSVEKCPGKTKAHLKFVLAGGTAGETTITAPLIIADTNVFDVLLGMDFLGPLFGYLDPLTEEFMWRVDCHRVETMPSWLGRLPASCRNTTARETRHMFMAGVIEQSSDLQDVVHRDETMEEQVGATPLFGRQAVSITPSTVALSLPTFATFPTSHLSNNPFVIHRRHEAAARLDAALGKKIPELLSRTKWIGDDTFGALPISTGVRNLD